MNIHCPTCETGYEIPPLLRPRRMRCTQCSTEWRETPLDTPITEPDIESEPSPDATIAAIPAAPPTIPDATERLASTTSAPPDRRIRLVWAALWALSLLLVVGCLFALWHWRDAIGHRWPPSLRLYRLIPAHTPPATIRR
jgi:hypothetical protein